jgi:hypothetical protein
MRGRVRFVSLAEVTYLLVQLVGLAGFGSAASSAAHHVRCPPNADIFTAGRHVGFVPMSSRRSQGTSPNEISSTSTPIRVLLGGVFRMT